MPGIMSEGWCRPPGVEHGRESDAGAEVLGVGGDGDQGLGGGFEQQVIDNGLVVIGNVGDRSGRVKTTWKYGTGKSSAWRSASHSLAAAAWHFGQCRLPQEF